MVEFINMLNSLKKLRTH